MQKHIIAMNYHMHLSRRLWINLAKYCIISFYTAVMHLMFVVFLSLPSSPMWWCVSHQSSAQVSDVLQKMCLCKVCGAPSFLLRNRSNSSYSVVRMIIRRSHATRSLRIFE